jgi:hypothetical protein
VRITLGPVRCFCCSGATALPGQAGGTTTPELVSAFTNKTRCALVLPLLLAPHAFSVQSRKLVLPERTCVDASQLAAMMVSGRANGGSQSKLRLRASSQTGLFVCLSVVLVCLSQYLVCRFPAFWTEVFLVATEALLQYRAENKCIWDLSFAI